MSWRCSGNTPRCILRYPCRKHHQYCSMCSWHLSMERPQSMDFSNRPECRWQCLIKVLFSSCPLSLVQHQCTTHRTDFQKLSTLNLSLTPPSNVRYLTWKCWEPRLWAACFWWSAMQSAESWSICNRNSFGFWLLSFGFVCCFVFVVFCHVTFSHNYRN